MLGIGRIAPRQVAIATGTVAAALGVAVLVAWHFHFTPVIQVVPTLPAMRRMAALEFLLGGIALCLVSSGRKRAGRVFAWAMLIPAVLVALEYVLKADFRIDQLLGRDDVSPLGSYPDRLRPVTTLCFLAASLSLLAMSSRTFSRRLSGVVGILASAIIAVGAVNVLAYLAHTQAFGWGYFSRIAIHTGIGHALVGAGLLALAWEERPAKEGLPRWVPLGLGLGVAVAVVGIWQALLTHRESMFPLLSGIVLGGGFLLAVLLALAVHQTQEARSRTRELQEQKAMLELLFEASPDALIVTDREGRITRANQRSESVFGYRPEELVGESIDCLVPEKLQQLHRVHRGAYYESPKIRCMGGALEIIACRKNGTEFPAEIHLSPLHVGRGIQVLEVVRDVTERRLAQDALRRSEERFRGVFETSPLGLALIRPDYRLAKVNASLCRMSGYSEAELTGANPFDFTHPDDRPKSMELAERLFKGEIPSYQMEKRYVKKNGEIIWANMTATILRDRDGNPLLGLGMVADITERRRAEEALGQSEERFRGVFEQGPIGLTLIGLDYRFVKVNEAFCRMMGYPEAELMKMTPLDIVHPDDLESTVARVERLLKTEAPIQNVEKRYVKKNGEVIWGSLNSALIHDHEGRPLYAMGMIEDITIRKRAEEELRTLSQRLSQAIRFASMGVWEWDPRANSFVWDDTTFELSGMPKVVPLPYEQWARTVHPDDLPDAATALLRVVQEKTQESMEFRIIRPDGDLRHAYAAGGPVLDQQGNVVRVVGIVVDITERKRAEEALRTLGERLSLATRIASIAVWDWDLQTDLGVWDDSCFEIFGMPKMNPVRHRDFIERIHPEDLPKLEASTQRVVRDRAQESLELRITRPDGSMRNLSVAEGAVLDEQGNVARIIGIVIDVTDRKQMESRLEATREQMIASARLSALGMMAGGIAHEINNPLAIIHAMASDLVAMVEEEGTAPPETVARKGAIIRETADRIARIVKSLRRISREGSSDKLHPTPLAKILDETLEICRERFRANRVELILPDSIPELRIACREVQIAQALLNLLQNAFDAVVEQPGERWVRIHVKSSDDSVEISVTDNGPGIPPDLRSRIMEPFFTTKEVGKGTGLGLSLSKTIAEEHGGKLEFGERDGHTCFALVLPRVKEEAEAA